MRRIPVRSLRRMKRQMTRMLEEIDTHYPGMMRDDTYTGWSNSQTETIRNLATAEAEIGGWITTRIGGRRRDPVELALQEDSRLAVSMQGEGPPNARP